VHGEAEDFFSYYLKKTSFKKFYHQDLLLNRIAKETTLFKIFFIFPNSFAIKDFSGF
jgi:hypothetical protein